MLRDLNDQARFHELYRQVIYRALCDALGFTNLDKKSNAHKLAITESTSWFYDQSSNFRLICELAGYNSEKVSSVITTIIESKQSGDHSKIAPFWREAFRRNRMPAKLQNIDVFKELS